MTVGDKVYQIKYDWGKKPNGKYYVFEVYSVFKFHNADECVDCYGGERGRCVFISSETFIKINDIRIKKLNKILNERN